MDSKTGGGYKRWEKERNRDSSYHPYSRGRGERRDDRRGRDKRREYDTPLGIEIESRIKTLIVRVADKSATLSENIEKLVAALESDIDTHKDTILKYIFECVIYLPAQTPVYGTLVGLLNLKNADFGKEVVNRTSSGLQEALEKNNYDQTKFLVRFLGELVNANVLLPSSLTDLFHQFLGILNEDNVHPRRAEFFVFLVMATLPWAAKELAERKADEFQKIWNIIETFITKAERKANPILYVYEVDASGEYLDELWRRLEQLRKDMWETASILKPWLHFEGKLNNAMQHTLPPITLPPHTTNSRYGHPQNKFRLFDFEETEKGIKPIDRFILEENIIDLLFYFNLNHKECVTHIEELPAAANIDQLVVETIFSQLFKLPKPPNREVYYAVIISDICKTKPSFPPILGQAIENLFERLDNMDAECVDRFALWFSHHLSNFDYKWNWNSWDYALKLKADSWKPVFIREVLERATRLSYYERVKKTIPEEFYRLLPEKPAPTFKYEAETTEGYAEAKMLLAKFQAKESSDSIQASLLEGEVFSKFSSEDKLDILMHCIIKMGSKSVSHLLAVTERYLHLLQKYIHSPDMRMIALRAVKYFWQKSPQHITITMDRLMTIRVIDNTSIVNWIFSPEEQQNFTKGCTWDILRNTINKTLLRTETVKEELKTAEKEWEKIPKDEQSESIPEFKRLKDRRTSLESALREQKELFLIVFQRFCMCLSEYLSQESNASYHNEFWYTCTVGHLKEVGRKYHHEILPFLSTLETLLFSNVDPRLAAVFQHIKNI